MKEVRMQERKTTACSKYKKMKKYQQCFNTETAAEFSEMKKGKRKKKRHWRGVNKEVYQRKELQH